MNVLVFLIGLAAGSFVGAIIHRLPRKEQFIGGRSYCPDCRHILRWYDLLPIFSFLILLGRCRYCRGRISWDCPAVELCSGIIWAASFLFLFPLGLGHWLFWVFVLELFLILAFIDLKHFILPDSVMVVVLTAFAVYGILGGKGGATLPMQTGSLFSLGNMASSAFFFLVFFSIWNFTNGKGIGLGDAKLAGLVGLVFGFWGSVFILYIAIIAGALAGLALILFGRGNLKTKLPLGAFISFSVIFFALFGSGVSGKAVGFFEYLLFKVNLF